MPVETRTQCAILLKLLLDGRELTGLEALDELRSMRLAARIFDLKKSGFPIVDRWVTTPSGKNIKAYRLDFDGGFAPSKGMTEGEAPR